MAERLIADPETDEQLRRLKQTKIVQSTPDSPDTIGNFSILLASGLMGSPIESSAYTATILPVEVTTGLATATYAGDSLRRTELANRG